MQPFDSESREIRPAYVRRMPPCPSPIVWILQRVVLGDLVPGTRGRACKIEPIIYRDEFRLLGAIQGTPVAFGSEDSAKTYAEQKGTTALGAASARGMVSPRICEVYDVIPVRLNALLFTMASAGVSAYWLCSAAGRWTIHDAPRSTPATSLTDTPNPSFMEVPGDV